jgi:hypothetical protein
MMPRPGSPTSCAAATEFARTSPAWRADLTITLSDEIVSPRRIAFAVDITLHDGRRIYEHVILWINGSTITRQVDVEVWD